MEKIYEDGLLNTYCKKQEAGGISRGGGLVRVGKRAEQTMGGGWEISLGGGEYEGGIKFVAHVGRQNVKRGGKKK